MPSRRMGLLVACKERLVGRWLRLQDRAEALNQRIYELSCRIERINREIELQGRKEARKTTAGRVEKNDAPPALRDGTGT